MLRLRPSLIRIALFSALSLLIASQTARAATITLTTIVGANVGCQPEVTCPDLGGDQDGSFQTIGTGPISVSDQTDTFADPNFTYLAKADASFGALHTYASGSFNLASPDYRGAFAGAIETDYLTISPPVGSGLTGAATLNVTYTVDGSVTTTGTAGAAVLAGISWGQNPDAFDPSNTFSGTDGLTTFNTPIPTQINFVWGQGFYLSMINVVIAGTHVTCLACNGGDSNLSTSTGIGSGTADFYNTMLLTGLVPLDANGAPILNAQYTSASGTQYGAAGVVPEPTTVVLLGTGLVAAFRKRRSVRSK